MAEIIDGKKISQEIKDELKEKVQCMKADGKEVTEDDFQPRRHKKIFAKDEGEYVDFEEIK